MTRRSFYGWPLAHAVYPGNLNDEKATLAIIGELKHRFAFRKVLFVADRGAVGTSSRAFR
ncbi:hypothetical protein [Geochorda subterranea]|uniref:Transposase n=1 Tax=Geochorda subterranea TaxID=3109564 RepID=A0ABZ1BQ51_9FIRM|nr:hypothetical protein [Limnochorda sp. LNt]WRP14536.1 hypothetical protein VLY81_14150 [Limnochorda sp. LNt]